MKIAFFDIDGTVVDDTSGYLFVFFAAQHGKFARNIEIKAQKTRSDYFNRNITYENFAANWGEELGEGLKGQKQSDIYALTQEFWQIIKSKVAYWAKDLIALLNNSGFTTVAISGSNIELIELYKDKLGFHKVFGTVAEVNNGIYTGKVETNLILIEAKSRIVIDILHKEDVDLQNSFGFGDTQHDRAFLDKVGHPIVINPDDKFSQYVKDKGWLLFKFQENVHQKLKFLIANTVK